MKKMLIILTFFGGLFLGLTTVNAATISDVDLRNIETNTYIVGNRIYELNKYPISLYDVVSASVEYANNNGGDMAPIYYYVGSSYEDGFLIEFVGPIDPETGIAETEIVEIEDAYVDGLVPTTYVNNSDYEESTEDAVEDLDAKLEELAEELNKTAADYGFESITYDAESKTGTFKIDALNTELKNYKDSGIVDMFLAFMENAEEVTYYIDGEEVTVKADDLTSTNVINIAYALLSDMAGDAEELNYAAVANQSASATVAVIRNGFTCYETYTLYFEFDFEKLSSGKDEELTTLAGKLNETAADYGFESITYDADSATGTFKIANLKADLANYKDSGIVDMFLAFVEDAYSVTYYIDGEEVTVKVADLTSTNVINIAYALLADMAGDAEELNYAAVANKYANAYVTYLVAGQEYTYSYSLCFEFDVVEFETAKEEEIDTLAKELNKTAANYGFESISYDADNRTGVFKIAALNTELANYKDSGIVDMFLTFVADADKVTYYIDGEEVTVKVADLTSTNVINIAYALLADMAGDAEELNYAAVAYQYATAYVTYIIGGQEYTYDYSLYFDYDFYGTPNKILTSLAGELNETAADYGFESITYDAEAQMGTFKIANLKAELANYKDSGIVDMFLGFIADADEVTYYIAGEPVTVKVADLTSTNVINIAYALLADMAGDAEELNYAAVANKYATAEVKYVLGGETLYNNFTLYFEYDVKEVKNTELTTLAGELNETAIDYGFESITYDETSQTGTFTIAEPTTELANYKDSGIVDMFLTFIEDAEEVTYYIAGEEVTVKVADLTSTNVINIAYALLSDMAGDAEELNYAAVAGKTSSADVKYVIGGETITETYTLSFKLAE